MGVLSAQTVMTGRKDHWDKVYETREPSELTWYQPRPQRSLELIQEAGLAAGAPIIDVGGGTSLLPRFLLEEGLGPISVLDVSGRALDVARERLGDRASEVEWIESDLLDFDPRKRWDLWHDRAVFHFLTSESDQAAYVRILNRALAPGGHLILATFALDGPQRCSGLDCARHGPESLEALLGRGYHLRRSLDEAHETPKGGSQKFTYCWFQRGPAATSEDAAQRFFAGDLNQTPGSDPAEPESVPEDDFDQRWRP